MIYRQIKNKADKNKKQLAILIDPDKCNTHDSSLIDLANLAEKSKVDLFFVGGSIINKSFDSVISILKKHCAIPVVLFPGSLLQISDMADGILFISLISGRNPELLIGNHVLAAPFLKNSSIEVISTGYMLIDSGKQTSVEYISQTKPIPADKSDIAVATAIAGEMLGHKLIYMDAGSGAKNAVKVEMITEVKKNISIPLIIGGGLKSETQIHNACTAGADIVVVGNAIEQNFSLLSEFCKVVHEF